MGRAKLDSDEEMSASPPQKASKGRQSAGGGSSKKKNEPSPAPSDEEEEDYDLEDIRDVAWQVNPKTGKEMKGKWQYFVKWLNYPETENSWVIEEDFNDKEMIAGFWARNEDHDLHPDRFKPAAKGRKSNASAAPRSSLSNNKSRSKLKDEDSDDDAASSKAASKRKNSSKDHDEDDIVEATPDTEQEERPKKKPKKASIKKKSEEVEENGFFSDAEAPTAGAGHDLNAMQKHMNKKNWETLIETIETVERAEDDLFMVYFTATDGSKAICSSEVLADKAPKKLIKFYEAHLRWRGPEK